MTAFQLESTRWLEICGTMTMMAVRDEEQLEYEPSDFSPCLTSLYEPSIIRMRILQIMAAGFLRPRMYDAYVDVAFGAPVITAPTAVE